jgi:hypothetical protein
MNNGCKVYEACGMGNFYTKIKIKELLKWENVFNRTFMC